MYNSNFLGFFFTLNFKFPSYLNKSDNDSFSIFCVDQSILQLLAAPVQGHHQSALLILHSKL